MNYVFSERISSLKPSAIREILKATSDPSVIPFAAGTPDSEAFPIDEVREISQKIFADKPILALQYGITEGYAPLRGEIKEMLKADKNIGTENDEIIITSGATQIMDLMTKVFCNFGDTVVCETPSFIGSLNCFRSYGCQLAGVPVTADGMDTDALEETLKNSDKVKFIYTIPNFQNPSGATMSLQKRKKLYELAVKYGVMILEDDPYGDTRVTGENLPSIKSMDTEGIVCYAGSFSKVLAPGIRTGYVCAPKEVIAKMTVGKQAADTHSTMFSQILVDEWLRSTDLPAHLEKIRAIYRRKLNLMCDLTEEKLGGFVEFVRPEGGLFVWCKLPENVKMLDFVGKCVENKLAVVPGTAFAVNAGDAEDCFRMNFSTPSDEQIVKGMDILEKVKEGFIG